MSRFTPPLRKEYLARQREHFGRRALGVFPGQYPRELLWAMGILPVEIWDPPSEAVHAGAHLQPSICSVVRQGLELILQGKCAQVDGFLFPHTCDSVQNLASLVNNYIDQGKPCYFLYNPKAPHSSAARDYYAEELKVLAEKLGARFGPLDEKDLRVSAAKGHKIDRLIDRLYRRRREGRVCFSNREFYQVLRQGEFLHPDEFMPLLEDFLDDSPEGGRNGIPVFLSGVLPGPSGFLSLLDQAGLYAGDDDLINCARRIPRGEREETDDPFESMVEKYFNLPPCTTRNSAIQDRLEDLFAKIEACGARGVIFSMVKFCEPELFDLPRIVQGLKDRGLPTLVIDWEVNQPLSGQMRTRLEAFAEMLAQAP